MGKLLLFMIIVPLIDLVVLFKVAHYISWGTTVALVIITGLIGHHLLRKQGTVIMNAIRTDMQQGALPGNRILSGLLLLIGGILLLSPGFLTDGAGLLLMIPGVRRILLKKSGNFLQKMVHSGSFRIHTRP